MAGRALLAGYHRFVPMRCKRFATLSVWYKTKFKFGIQNFGSQPWWPFVHRLPKLVANISSQFHHLVNTGLAVGSLVKWLPIKYPYLQISHNLSGLLLDNCKWLHSIVITFNTLCLVEFCIEWCGALQWTHWCSYFKQLIYCCLGS